MPVREGDLGVASLALPAFLASAANTLSLQALILTDCSGSSPDCHFLQAYLSDWSVRFGTTGQLPPQADIGIAPSLYLTAFKFSPSLTVLFNWPPSWLLPRVIVETGCLRCRLRPVASNSTTRLSGLQSVYVLGWTCVSSTFADADCRSTLAVCTALPANRPLVDLQASHIE